MTRQQQRVLAAGDGDVQQPALLVDAALLELSPVRGDLVRQLLSIGHVRGVQDRHAVHALGGPVPAQQRRQVGGVGEPGAGLCGRREQSARQVRHGDHLPLQTLGGVDGQHLHPVLRDDDLGRRQAVLDDRGCVQVGQQPDDRGERIGRRRSFGVAVDHVGEGVELFGAGPAAAETMPHAPRSRHRAVGAPRPPDRAADGRDGRAACSAPRRAPRCADTLPLNSRRPGPDRRARRPGPRQSACGPAASAIRSAVSPERAACPPSELRARAATAPRRRAAPSRQRGPVSTRIAAAPAVGSATRRSIATTSATSGTDSSPASPTTSTGTPRARRAAAIGAASALRRTRTAAVGGATSSAAACW